jgi:hypothetical protein
MNPPRLNIDNLLYGDQPVPARNALERKVVWNLLTYLQTAGFHVQAVNDGENIDKVATPQEAMELVFNLDDCVVYMHKPGYGSHGVQIVLGNGVDVISDHSYFEDDRDGFRQVMDDFDAEDLG